MRLRYNLACALTAYLHDNAGAVELLNPYFDGCSAEEWNHCKTDPDMDALRDDPRFCEMLSAASERLGIAN
ncbi:hypothetical protein GRI58_05450 [Porphyrobacter algicida]|uniref:Uncharacterized protein n=1 Tax=Qipengyuania algicida TaxID=1836209 RepID=A0A845AHG7_9SPHN|nr:hypothetical protein [Qipengyuania algicida]MXP28265.1 hypothetical protein [Qipengyuania algicida]